MRGFERQAHAIVVSAEHASCRVPAKLAHLFDSDHARRAVASHRGWDPGTKILALDLADAFTVSAVVGRYTRLAIELNRSRHHRALFSEFVSQARDDEKEWLIDTVYKPHWRRVVMSINAGLVAAGRVVHVAVHSFVPVLDGVCRPFDVGLLYDPSRASECTFARHVAKQMAIVRPQWKVCRNQPYRGVSDGLPTTIRRHLQASAYIGLEVEINQKLVSCGQWGRHRRALARAVVLATRLLHSKPL